MGQELRTNSSASRLDWPPLEVVWWSHEVLSFGVALRLFRWR